MFWPELNQQAARNALRQVLHRLRRGLGDAVIVTRGAEEIAVDASALSCDVVELDGEIERGDDARALALYRGELLPGFYLSGVPDFERWLDDERARLRDTVLNAAWRLADAASTSGDGATAAHWAQRAAAFKPDDERAQRRLLELLMKHGDAAGARRAYDAFARRLSDEMEIEPSAETRALVAAVPAAWPAATAMDAPPRPRRSPVDGIAIPEPARRRSRWIVAVALTAVIVVAVLAALWRSGSANVGADAPANTRALAVVPFTVRGSPDLAYLREGMVDLLSAKLDGVPGLRPIEPRRSIAAASRVAGGGAAPTSSDPAGVTRVARELQAPWVLTGDLVELAGRVEVSAVLYDVTSAPRVIAKANVAGETTNLFELVDDLAGRILAAAAVGRDTVLTRMSALTTHSLPALKSFLEGEQALRAGQEARAAAAFVDAASRDTTFALAQYRLALSGTWTLTPDVPNPVRWAAAAARNAQHLPPLVRDLLTAYGAYKVVDAETCERIYRAVTQARPDNVEAWLMLGETWFHLNPWRGRSAFEARIAFRRVLELDSTNTHALIHLARLAAKDGRIAELDTLTRAFARYHADADRLLEMRALRAYAVNDTAERARIADAARMTNDLTKTALLDAAMAVAQNPGAVEDLAPILMETLRDTILNRYARTVLSELSLVRGQWGADRSSVGRMMAPVMLMETEALVASEPFFAVPRERIASLRDSIAHLARYPYVPLPSAAGIRDTALAEPIREYLVGLLSAASGDSPGAEKAVRALERTRGTTAEIATNLAIGLRSEIFRRRGDNAAALAALERFRYGWGQAQLRFVHWGQHERFARAEVLRALGRGAEAVPWYESVVNVFDQAFAAPAHFRMAEIAERRGATAEARFHNAMVVRLWESADAPLRPVVDRARQSLAAAGR